MIKIITQKDQTLKYYVFHDPLHHLSQVTHYVNQITSDTKMELKNNDKYIHFKRILFHDYM